MAAGLVYSNMTTAAGVTFTIARWVPDTTVPLANAIPIHALVDATGTPISVVAGGVTPNPATNSAIVVAVRDMNINGATTSTLSAPVVGATDEATRAAALDTSFIANGAANTKLTPKFAKIVASASGVTTIVALVAAKKLRVLGLKITANGAVNVKWQSHVTPTDLTGLSYFAAAGDGEVIPFSPVGWFETVAGEALDINLSGAVAVGGHLVYVEV